MSHDFMNQAWNARYHHPLRAHSALVSIKASKDVPNLRPASRAVLQRMVAWSTFPRRISKVSFPFLIFLTYQCKVYSRQYLLDSVLFAFD